MELHSLKQRKSSGFTLIEVLVTLVLTGLLIAIITGTVSQTVFTQQHLEGRGIALIIGHSKLAELENGSEPASSGTFPPPYSQFNWFAKEETTDADTQLIRLTVTWEITHGTPEQLQLQGYR